MHGWIREFSRVVTHANPQEDRLRPDHAGNIASHADWQRSARLLCVSRVGGDGQRHCIRLPRQYDVISRLVDQMRIDYQPRTISSKTAFEPDRIKLLPASFVFDLKRLKSEVRQCEAILKAQSDQETALPASDNAELKLIRETLTKLHQIETTVNQEMLADPQMSG